MSRKLEFASHDVKATWLVVHHRFRTRFAVVGPNGGNVFHGCHVKTVLERFLLDPFKDCFTSAYVPPAPSSVHASLVVPIPLPAPPAPKLLGGTDEARAGLSVQPSPFTTR